MFDFAKKVNHNALVISLTGRRKMTLVKLDCNIDHNNGVVAVDTVDEFAPVVTEAEFCKLIEEAPGYPVFAEVSDKVFKQIDDEYGIQ